MVPYFQLLIANKSNKTTINMHCNINIPQIISPVDILSNPTADGDVMKVMVNTI